MNKTRVKTAFVALLIAIMPLACGSPTSAPEVSDDIDPIQVQKTQAIQKISGTEEFSLPNCGGSSELSQSLGTQTSVKKGVVIGAKASTSVGGEVEIPLAAKLKLEAAVELAYQQDYETATSRLDTIVMKAAPMSHVIYVVQWDEQRFESIVAFGGNEETYQASYSYVLRTPKISDSYQVSCPTPTLPPSATIDAMATAMARAAQTATAERIAADETATAVAREADAAATATVAARETNVAGTATVAVQQTDAAATATEEARQTAVAVTATWAAQIRTPTPSVGIVLPTNDEARWIQDETRFRDAFSAAGYDVQTLFSEGNPATEKANVESLIKQGVWLIVICPVDTTEARAAADEAETAGVKVISYDRPIRGTPIVDYYPSIEDAIAATMAYLP